MDSFTIVFTAEISLETLTHVLEGLDKNLTITIQDDDTVSVAKSSHGNREDEAHVWIEFYGGDGVTAQLAYHHNETALRNVGAKTLLNISVRRNAESSLLAVQVAIAFSRALGGVISWDGMDYWEAFFHQELSSPKGASSS